MNQFSNEISSSPERKSTVKLKATCTRQQRTTPPRARLLRTAFQRFIGLRGRCAEHRNRAQEERDKRTRACHKGDPGASWAEHPDTQAGWRRPDGRSRKGATITRYNSQSHTRRPVQAGQLNKARRPSSRQQELAGGIVPATGDPWRTCEARCSTSPASASAAFTALPTTSNRISRWQDLLFRTDQVIRHEIDVTAHQLHATTSRSSGAGGVRGCPHRAPDARGRSRLSGMSYHRGSHRHRHRHHRHAGSPHPLRRPAHLRQRRHSAPRQAAAHADRGRRAASSAANMPASSPRWACASR